MKRIQHTVYYCLLVIGSIVSWAWMSAAGLLDGLEQEAMRWRYEVRGELGASDSIVYVDLDAKSVASIGARPWDRANFAVLLHALLGPGEAKAVGLDIIFSQLGRGSLLDLERAKAGDLAFGQAVKAYQDKVVLAAAYTGTTGPEVVPLLRLGFDNPKENVFPEAPTFPIIDWNVGRLGLANVDEALGKGVIPQWVVGFVEIEGELYSRALMSGMRNHFYEMMNEPAVVETGETFSLTDKDGWTPQQIPRISKRILYSLGLEMFLVANELTHDAVERTPEALIIRKDGTVLRRVPLAESQAIEVNWFDGWKTSADAEHVSLQTLRVRADSLSRAAKRGDALAVAAEEKWFKRFKDKVVFVGPVDPQLKDIAPTPYNREPVPKVGLHANLFRTIDSEAYIKRASGAQSLLVLIGLPLVVTFLTLWKGFGRTVTRFGSVLLVATYATLVFGAFSYANVVLPLIAPVGAAMTAALGLMLIRLGAEELERRRIKSLFGAYVSPQLVDEMLEAQRDPELGGVEADISALFSDVEGFTALSEQLHPSELVNLMNEYLGAMTEEVQAAGGTLDKYIGDALVAMFGMPLPVSDHAGRACAAALRMQERHAELRRQWAASAKWPDTILNMRTRIGINTGNAVIGNMGSRVRFNYTMMGDSVNLAARCESGAKSYGVYTMVSEFTLTEALKTVPDLNYRKLDRVVVKGRSHSVELYELWDKTVNVDEAAQCREHYTRGLEQYFIGDWSAAIESFEQALAYEPSRSFAPTTPSAVMLERCADFLKVGVPTDWDGVFRMQTK